MIKGRRNKSFQMKQTTFGEATITKAIAGGVSIPLELTAAQRSLLKGIFYFCYFIFLLLLQILLKCIFRDANNWRKPVFEVDSFQCYQQQEVVLYVTRTNC